LVTYLGNAGPQSTPEQEVRFAYLAILRAQRCATFGRSRDRFPVVSMDFSVTYSFRPYHGPGVDSAPSENEYQERFLGVKAAGAWGWCHHVHVLNVMEIWEPKPPGTLWATPGLDRGPLFIYHRFHRLLKPVTLLRCRFSAVCLTI